MQIADYPGWTYEIQGVNIAVVPIIVFVGLTWFVLALKYAVESRIRRKEFGGHTDSFFRRLLLYPVEIALIPAVGFTTETFGISTAASDSIAVVIPITRFLIGGIAWVIWYIVLRAGVRVALEKNIRRLKDEPFVMVTLSVISMLLYAVFWFGSPSNI